VKKTLIRDEETLDDLIIGGLKLIQPRKGYRFSIDPVLLAHFAGLNKVKRAIDLGCGNGIIIHLLAALSPELEITGIEIQEQMVERAQRSIAYNGLESRVQIINRDIRDIEKYLSPGSFDLVISNPPFWSPGQGRISSNPEEAIARHELTLSLEELIKAAAFLLAPGKSFCIIHRAERLIEIINLCKKYKLLPSRLRAVYSFPGQEAKMVLLEAQKRKQGPFKLLSPLIIYKQPGEYSEEVMSYYYGQGR